MAPAHTLFSLQVMGAETVVTIIVKMIIKVIMRIEEVLMVEMIIRIIMMTTDMAVVPIAVEVVTIIMAVEMTIKWKHNAIQFSFRISYAL
jgi:hypothetical protein